MTADTRTLHEAARVARRFQLVANLHLDTPNPAALQRDGQVLFDLLYQMGFRPVSQTPSQ